ncbi:MAG: GTP-binding protein [Candidatus Lokiarchaeota archaeon]|nr:GTP-binding protein [Candidatus Lokiarchaeota archaeon]
MNSKPIILKVLTAGEGGVGKTTILHRYVDGIFMADTRMTIGVEFFLKELVIDGKNVALQLWDFGGQERFRFLLQSYAAGAKGALIMFDLTRPLTLDRIEEWINICRSGNSKAPILFLGTKSDLDNDISVDDDYVSELIEKYNFIDYLKVSSKTGENVHKSFEILSKEILKKLGII